MTAPLATNSVAAEHLALARAYVSRDCEIYGLPGEGALYENLLAYLINPDVHDFRLTDLPGLAAIPDFLRQPRRILDVGCGPGTLVWKALRNGHDAWGIDLNEQKIDLARSWAASLAYPNEWLDRVQVHDAGKLPYADESFDLVTSYHVIEHVSDLPSVLYEAVRVTKRGGWLQLCAPDYRMSYDTHYCMAWPRFMPPSQAAKWCEAMGRPTAGIGSFFYVTAPQVTSLLTALGCRIQTLTYREHRDGRVFPSQGQIGIDPIMFRSDADVTRLAQEVQGLQAAGTLPNIYKTCLEFTIAAQRL